MTPPKLPDGTRAMTPVEPAGPLAVMGRGPAAEGITDQITNVMQIVLAVQLLREGLDSTSQSNSGSNGEPDEPATPSLAMFKLPPNTSPTAPIARRKLAGP